MTRILRKRISKTELNRYGDYDEYATEKRTCH